MDSTNKKIKINSNIFNSKFFKTKKAMSTILVLILLLLMSVYIFVLISNHFKSTTDDFKITQQLDNFEQNFEIIKISGSTITIKNSFRDNLKLDSIKINGVSCDLPINIMDIGTSGLTINNCQTGLSLNTIYPVIIQTDFGVKIENEILETLP